jgi:hypothetical protein
MASTKSLVVLGLAAVLFSPACFHGEEEEDVPLAGSWESDERVGGYRNTLDIDENLTGSATLYFYYDDDPDLYYADYIAVASELEASGSYLVSMICDGSSCSDLDFTMTCGVIGAMYLDCAGSGLFATYDVLYFERNG